MHLRLENFDGPLDLLVHLIKAHEVNIFNIPITLICEQYLGFLRQVTNLDFHQAGEYLAMAAQLIEIKANLLLPALQRRLGEPQSLSDMADNDPRKPLVELLLEYEAIKEACLKLESLPMLGRDVFASGESIRRQAEFEDIASPIKGDPFSLVIAFERLLLKFADKQSAPRVRVETQRITIQHKMTQIKNRFEIMSHFTLRELFDDCETRYELIVTIMAMLELAKANVVNMMQENMLGPIILTQGDKFETDLPLIEDENQAAVPVVVARSELQTRV